MRDFEFYKEKALREFNKAKSLKLIDKKILSLLEFINSLPDFYTTSSCSGRITIDSEGNKKKDHLWLLKTHKTLKLDDFINTLKLIEKNKNLLSNAHLKVDSFILHVGARDLDKACEFLSLVKKVGLKRTGIIQVKPRILIEIVGLDRLDIPIFEKKFLIKTDEGSLKILVDLVNKKLVKNWERIYLLESALKSLK